MARDEQGVGEQVRVIRPSLPPRAMLLINAFIDAHQELPSLQLAENLRRLHAQWADEAWSLDLRGVALVIADLLDQGWAVRPADNTIELQPPGLRTDGETADQANERIRDAMRIARQRQLQEPGVRVFVERMQRPVKRGEHRTSIENLIDSGPELASGLRAIRELATDKHDQALAAIFDPEIEACDEQTKCPDSGLRLMDIWRYFRHTWSLEYRSVPGRQLPLLIRNAARPGRPVMGIAMLASPVVRTKPRDHWIGWVPEALTQRVEEGRWPAEMVVGALYARLNSSIAELRTDDLASDEELAEPSERAILRVEQRAAGAAHVRKRRLQSAYTEMVEADEGIRSDRGTSRSAIEDADLIALSNDPLFIHKRAETLWKLLEAKRAFHESNCLGQGERALAALQAHPLGARALSIALSEVRKAALASEVADLSVCGAAPPYNGLLGGKLVALLSASEEARRLYEDRYTGRASIISSQMAGRLIVRPASLKVLTTTSLYGNSSSQYNRLHLRAADYPQLGRDLRWERLARTEGFGTFHLSPATVRVLREVSEAARGARWVNNRFGEGASPRMRQSREGLDALGIDSSAVLNHATPRLFYGCQLTDTAMEELMGMAPSGSSRAPAAGAIADAWRRRWLSTRIQNDDVLARVEAVDASTIASDLS